MRRSNVLGALVLLGILGLVISAVVIAQQQGLTLTTYYPAPFGEYQQLRVMGDTNPATVDLTVGQGDGAGNITQEGTVQIDGDLTVGQPGDLTTQDRNLTVSGDVTIGDVATPTTSTLSLHGNLIVDDNDDGQEDVTIGAVGDNAVLNVNGVIKVNGNPIAGGGLPHPDFDSGWVAIPLSTTVTVTHNLATPDYLVYLEGRDQPAGNIHGIYTIFYWENKTADTIQVTRGGSDVVDEFRIRLWKFQP